MSAALIIHVHYALIDGTQGHAFIDREDEDASTIGAVVTVLEQLETQMASPVRHICANVLSEEASVACRKVRDAAGTALELTEALSQVEKGGGFVH